MLSIASLHYNSGAQAFAQHVEWAVPAPTVGWMVVRIQHPGPGLVWPYGGGQGQPNLSPALHGSCGGEVHDPAPPWADVYMRTHSRNPVAPRSPDGRVRLGRAAWRPAAGIYPPCTETGSSWEQPLCGAPPRLCQPVLCGHMAPPPWCWQLPRGTTCSPCVGSGRRDSVRGIPPPCCSGGAMSGTWGQGVANLGLSLQLSPPSQDFGMAYEMWDCPSQTRAYGYPRFTPILKVQPWQTFPLQGPYNSFPR